MHCGVRLSIDDFGTGYSSLSQLEQFPVSTLKNRPVVCSATRTTDPATRAIVSAIIRMAQALGMQTVAEGVETRGQFDFLHDQAATRLRATIAVGPSLQASCRPCCRLPYPQTLQPYLPWLVPQQHRLGPASAELQQTIL